MLKYKQIAKNILGKYNVRHLTYTKNLYSKMDNEKDKSLVKCFSKTKIVKLKKNKGEQIKDLFNKVEIGNVQKKDIFYYYIDAFKNLYNENSIIANLEIDYSKVLDYSLEDYKKSLDCEQTEFYINEKETIEAIELLINRTTEELKNQDTDNNIIKSLEGIKNRKALGFRDALQRILFFNQLLWQTGHFLNGLGRLDLILQPYYEQDINNDKINKEEIKQEIKEFLLELHKFYGFKSNSLMGDTGQIIILGGLDFNNKYEYNDLTYLFIEIVKELQLPDPKILLRVSKDMPRDLIEESLKCIQTGIGCPLFANDDVIIPKLIEFGINNEDAYNYGTSACWEPYIIGKSIAQNNMETIVFLQPLEELLKQEDLEQIKTIEELINKYKNYLKEYLESVKEKLDNIKWEKDPLLSLFIDSAIERCKDISEGGAVYNNYGVLTVSLANTVNSILNIDKLVFEEKSITLSEFNNIRNYNFNGQEELLEKIKDNKEKYGTDSEKVIALTNEIFNYTSEILTDYTNKLGGKIKIGLSSPQYIDAGKMLNASFDGRKKGEPFAVHISSDASNAYTELIQFASKLDYGSNRINGNVVDFIVSPNFIKDNFEKFVDFLLLSIDVGFFEMQMNVVSSKMLIEARKNPDKFPNLIVRVWGFSAYFKDLPDEYKDYLIERTLKSEGNSY